MDRALILFSRLPIGRETKTRLAPLLNEVEREGLHRALWEDVFGAALGAQADTFLYWTGSGRVEDYRHLIPAAFQLREQRGENLGLRMSNAMGDAFGEGYRKVVLMGTDVPNIESRNIRRAFDALDSFDVTLGPSLDGGYWLIGMRQWQPAVFDIGAWGTESVLNATLNRARGAGLSCSLGDALLDIDTPEDVRRFLASGFRKEGATRAWVNHVGLRERSHIRGLPVSAGGTA